MNTLTIVCNLQSLYSFAIRICPENNRFQESRSLVTVYEVTERKKIIRELTFVAGMR